VISDADKSVVAAGLSVVVAALNAVIAVVNNRAASSTATARERDIALTREAVTAMENSMTQTQENLKLLIKRLPQ
jgi:hypothetical protein